MNSFEAGGPQTRATVVLQESNLTTASATVAPFSSNRPRRRGLGKVIPVELGAALASFNQIRREHPDGWVTVCRAGTDGEIFCRLSLERIEPYVGAGWFLPVYASGGKLSHLAWSGPRLVERRLGLNFSSGESIRGRNSGLMSPR
jgi:hypothetical protein